MDRLLELLFRNPVLVFLVGAWVVGMISNAAKVQRRRREREQAKTRPQPMPDRADPPGPPASARPSGGRAAPGKVQTPEEIAREMRRILGLERDPQPQKPQPQKPQPVLVEAKPVSPQDRSLDLHEASRVGASMRARHLRESRVGKPSESRGAVGDLGGRTVARRRSAAHGSRYALDDLRKAIVLSEILAQPVSLRPFEDRLP
ncbi:MAG TPA: hypothetical protein ENI87_07250 [bacterium]|nr:hypothetical protein [bacterium]